MAKVNFSKVEDAFDRAKQKLFIDNLSDLAAIANLIQDPKANLTSKTIADIIGRFQKELKKLKKQDAKLYAKLNLAPKVEDRFFIPSEEYRQEDWLQLKNLKVRIDELKKELYGEEALNAEFDSQIAKERRKHINKRFNIRDGWLPLK